MIISVTAPRKGLGQTVTAINLSAMITKLVACKLLLVDINRDWNDIEYYLSDSCITKGLDDFISLYESGLLNKNTFLTCIKKVYSNIHIMTSSQLFKVDEKQIDKLIEYINFNYKIAIIDTISGKSKMTRFFVNKSDVVVVIINQTKNSVNLLKDVISEENKNNTVIIVNKYIEKLKIGKVDYGLKHIRRDLKLMNISSKVFPLNFDIDIINECNKNSILNFILNKNYKAYISELQQIATYILNFKMDNALIKKEAVVPSKEGRLKFVSQ